MEMQIEEQAAVSAFLLTRWEQMSRKIATLVKEFPDEDYNWRPRNDMRTLGEAIRHVAFWNRYTCDSLTGKEPDGSLNELPAAEYPGKAEALKALRQSAEETSAALRRNHAVNGAKVAEHLIPALEHVGEHYGQLSVYARLRGIVPPESRG